MGYYKTQRNKSLGALCYPASNGRKREKGWAYQQLMTVIEAFGVCHREREKASITQTSHSDLPRSVKLDNNEFALLTQ